MFLSLGHNLIGDSGSSAGFGAPGDQVGTSATPLDPRLGPLAANGGTTPTRAPLAGSPLIDAGDPVTFDPTDQRGYARVGVADVGAHEFGATGGASVAGCTSAPNSTGANGAIALALDLDRHPTPGGLVRVLPGDTWYFQAWHRDSAAGTATSNFTAATAVTFTQ